MINAGMAKFDFPVGETARSAEGGSMTSTHTLRRARAWLLQSTLALLSLGAVSAWAQEDPPGRVGRLADIQGSVSMYDHEQGSWREAERNRPLTSGDRLSTGPQGRAEVRIGSTVLRLAGASELEVVRLDDARMRLQLHAGSLAVRVRTREAAADIDLITPEVRLRPERAGLYRIDRVDDSTQAGVLRGTLRIDDAEGFILETGQRAELWREGGRDSRPQRSLRFAWTSLPNDAFAEWVAREDSRDERSASSRYVSPEMTGAEDLERNGRWERHVEYGAVWYPQDVRADWAPYRYGRWAWVQPWGWTWVDEAPWGFAPFHYGRWVSVSGRWGWWPGEYVARPVYAPALVAWVGGANVGVSVSIGGPNVGWVPLAPREWYTPYYRATPVYAERVNPYPSDGRGPRWQGPPQVPTGPVMYTNQGVPGAVTVVPREVLLRRQPVSRAVVDINVGANLGAGVGPYVGQVGGGVNGERDGRRDAQRGPSQPLVQMLPPDREGRGQRVVAVPGGGQPSQGPVMDLRGERQQPSAAAPVVVPVGPAVQLGQPAQQGQSSPVRERDRDRGRDSGRDNVRDGTRDNARDNARESERGGRNGRDDRDAAFPARPVTGPAAQPAPAAVPARPATGPSVVTAPVAPPPAAAPPPPRQAPMSAPDRAREREAQSERDRAREQPREEERKRGPEPRGPQRERDNQH